MATGFESINKSTWYGEGVNNTIYWGSYLNIVYRDYRNRVEDDGGTFEAMSCVLNNY